MMRMILGISFLVPSAKAFVISSMMPPLQGTLPWCYSPHPPPLHRPQRPQRPRSYYATTTKQEQEEQDVVIDNFLASFQAVWTRNPSGAHINNKDKEEEEIRHYFVEDKEGDRSGHHRPFWRDMVAYTWNIVTLEGMDSIMEALHQPAICDYRSRSTFQRTHQPLPPRLYSHVIPSPPPPPPENKDDSFPHVRPTSSSPSPSPPPPQEEEEVIEFWADLTIERVGTGKVHFKLVRTAPLSFKIHTLLTTLMELTDRPFRVGSHRIRGHEPGAVRGRKYWPETHQRSSSPTPPHRHHGQDPVVIIGGGQAGLSLGARLHLMDIPYLILEAGDHPGMAWRKRYPSLHLHDPVWYNHMPYLPFPETWPVFCPRDKIADWLEFYATAMDLHIHTRCKVTQVEPLVRPTTHEGLETTTSHHAWKIMISCQGEKEEDDDDDVVVVSSRTMVAQHVVFATGNSSKPRIPTIPGHFGGLQIHSSQYCGGQPYRGRRVVVVGSNNSGWDIVQDLWEQGAEHVTMIQRSPSMVVSTTSVLTHGLGSLYRQDAPLHHEDADLVATSVPYKLMIPRWQAVTKLMQENDKDLLESLAASGYQLDDGPEGAGIFAKSATQGGGFYIDMGCAELVARKEVDVRYATAKRLESDGVVIQDTKTNSESRLFADVIVFATGFETMDQWVAQLCGDRIAHNVGRTWGLGLETRHGKDCGPWEGELRNMWKPTAVNGLWFHGGNLAQSRHYSRFLALQLAARYLDSMEPHVYGTPSPTTQPLGESREL